MVKIFPIPRQLSGGFSAWLPIPKARQGSIVLPPSVLAPGSALGSVPTVALSSAQVISQDSGAGLRRRSPTDRKNHRRALCRDGARKNSSRRP